ncbi:hypothetical protein RBB78_17515 [Tunturiibacter empetritectus]|uniref:hypothetical protein n=1 Tax=Tunturiibacter empetritectus TaxID=3069691 RepID=UPI003D9B10E8
MDGINASRRERAPPRCVVEQAFWVNSDYQRSWFDDVPGVKETPRRTSAKSALRTMVNFSVAAFVASVLERTSVTATRRFGSAP